MISLEHAYRGKHSWLSRRRQSYLFIVSDIPWVHLRFYCLWLCVYDYGLIAYDCHPIAYDSERRHGFIFYGLSLLFIGQKEQFNLSQFNCFVQILSFPRCAMMGNSFFRHNHIDLCTYEFVDFWSFLPLIRQIHSRFGFYRPFWHCILRFLLLQPLEKHHHFVIICTYEMCDYVHMKKAVSSGKKIILTRRSNPLQAL